MPRAASSAPHSSSRLVQGGDSEAAEGGEAATGSGEDKCIRIPFQAECEKDREDILEKFRLVLSTTGDVSRVKA